MICMQIYINAKSFLNSYFGRIQCYMLLRHQMSVSYADVKYGKVRKRSRRLRTVTGERQQLRSQRREPADKMKNVIHVNKFSCPKESGILQNILQMQTRDEFSETRPNVSYGKMRDDMIGPDTLSELNKNSENPLHHLKTVCTADVESDVIEMAPEYFTERVNQRMREKERKVTHVCKKKKQSYKDGTPQKGRILDSDCKIHRKNINREKKFKKSDHIARRESLFQSLLSYVDACISCGFLNLGMKAVMSYRKSNKQLDGSGVLVSQLFEVLLHGYAAKRNISKVEELMRVMGENRITQTAQCYAACFECVARRLNSCDNYVRTELFMQSSEIKKLHSWVSEMNLKNLTLNDLFAKTYLLYDQKKMVMTAVLKIDSHFKPVYPPLTESGYVCRLLEGIEELNQMGYLSPVSGLLGSEQLKVLSLKQLQNEIKGCLEITSIEKRQEPNELIIHQRKKLAQCQDEWRQVIHTALIRELKILRRHCQSGAKSHTFMNIYPFLASVKREELVELVLQEIQKLSEGSETFSSTTNQLHRELGSRVLERYQINWKNKNGILDKVKLLLSKYFEWFSNPGLVTLSKKSITCTRQAWQSLVHSHQNEGASLNFRERSWPASVQITIGRFLYGIILHEIMIDINILQPSSKSHQLPAFYTIFRNQKNGKLRSEEVKPHPVLVRLFRGATSYLLKFPTRHMPMLCPPIPWTTTMSGAYIACSTDVVRLHQQVLSLSNQLHNCPAQQLYPALDSLNQLGAVPWKINYQVLGVVINVFNSGGSSQLAIPPPPSSFTSPVSEVPPLSPEITSSDSGIETSTILQTEKSRQQRYYFYLRRKKAEAYSLWCDMLYRLSIANHLRECIFWLPHNMDFRGRVYPCPPHLSHLGSDVARSLLCFAKGQPLGPRGLNWLKLHLVNLTGLKKKCSMKERIMFAEAIMPNVIDSAEKPLKGDMWWAKTEEPWQTLAVCMEICAALKNPGGPENYVCHFPVHQDGSCNGLQHYAALGRDAVGAASVSMTPSELPQDVYSTVAAMVEKEREADAKLGVTEALILKGFVGRKVIKQTVMTTVYGVTRFGARLQIARQLQVIDDFPKEHVWRASLYLVGKTFECLREMFTSTKEIQDWFTNCAQLITQVYGQYVEWVTPLGFPVVQPYQHIGAKQSAPIQGFVKVPFECHERPNVMKQKNAFPPNFIHSIDSSHMMLTSLWCERKGLTFVSVHDCYWTHPSTVEIMNKICREQFVILHSQPILEDLSHFFIQKYSYSKWSHGDDSRIISESERRKNIVFTQVPKKGDYDLKSVLDSVYFFS